MTPLINPHERNEIWRGDGLELYLGFEGPTLAHQYGEHDYQIGISPGNDGKNPTVWNWKPKAKDAPASGVLIDKAKVAVAQTAKGYIIEAMIPLEAINETVETKKVIAFDIAVNNKKTPEAEAKEEVLMWAGDGANWRDPSNWGAAIIVEE
jgi:hypothetical protein